MYEDVLKKADLTWAVSSDFTLGKTTISPSLSIAKLEGEKTKYVMGFNASF